MYNSVVFLPWFSRQFDVYGLEY